MNSFLKICLFMVLALLGVICIEQILYRFSDGYAKIRTDFLRNQSEASTMGRILRIFPFDQLEKFPIHDGQARLSQKLDAETHYVHAALSHTRALRDKLYNELADPITLPADLPSQVTANKEGVLYLQIPTGKDVKVKATILRVLDSRQGQDESMGKLEQQITPIIRQGFACGILYANTANDLLYRVAYDLPAAVNKLDLKDKSFVRRVFGWGKGTSANILARAAVNSPDTFSVLALDSPGEIMFGEPPVNGPYVLFLTDEKTPNPVTVHAMEWVQQLRKGRLNSWAHRYSGMLVSTNAQVSAVGHYKLSLIYGFISEVERLLPALAPLPARPVPNVEFAPKPKAESPLSPEPTEQTSIIPAERVDDYNCETVQTYRSKGLNANWLKLSNRELILVLGKSFEKSQSLDHIRKQDPDFVFFYETIKLLDNP